MVEIEGVKLYLVEDIVEMCSRSLRSVRRDIAAGVLKGTWISRVYVFTEQDIENYKKARANNGKHES